MKRSKRLISLLCAFCLVVSLMPMQVFAAGLTPEQVSQLLQQIQQQTGQGTQTSDPNTPPKGSGGIILEREADTNNSAFSKFKDVKGHWAEEYLKWSVELGLFQGVSSTKFKPDSGITRAQLLAVITRAFGATKKADVSMYLDIDEESWYYEYVALAKQMGILSGYGNTIAPNEYVTRQEAAEALVKAASYTLSDLRNINSFKDYRTIDQNSRVYLATAIENGLMRGFSDQTLGPHKQVTRAQFAVMMHRMANAYYTPNHIYQERYVEGSLLVGMPDITLNNMYIDGDLFITEGCGESTITLKDTTVGGRIIVRGTGANTVKLHNSKAHGVIMCNPNNATSLYLDELSAVNNVTVRDGNGGVTLTGNLGDVYIDTAKCPVKINDSVVKTLYVNAKLSSVTADKLSSFDAIRIESTASGAAMDVAGAVGSLHIGASDTTVKLTGSLQSLTFGGGVSKVNLTLPAETVLKNANLSASKLKLTLTGNIGDLTVSGEDCVITLDGKTTAGDITISGDGSKVILQSGAEAGRITISCDDVSLDIESNAEARSVSIYGDDIQVGSGGEVSGGVTINRGDDIKISLPNCEVYNCGGTDVYVGPTRVEIGEVVVTNESGSDIVKPEEPEEEDPEEEDPEKEDPEDPEEPEDPENPGSGEDTEDDSNLPKPTISLVLASEGQPSDFGNGNAYTYSMFGYNLAFDRVTQVASGKLNKIENFYWYSELSGNAGYATGYYLPLVLTASESTSSAKLYIGDAVFTDSVISKGSAYSGQWMVYVPLSLEDIERGTVTVKFDPDGSGSEYGAGTATIDVRGIELVGGMYGDSLWRKTAAAPGLDGADTCKITIPSNQSTTDPFRISLSNEILLETRGTNGAFDYWAGLVFTAPRGAENAFVQLVRPDGSSTSAVYFVSSGKFTWYAEAGNTGANGYRTWALTITYRDSNQNNIDTMPTRTILVDMSGVNLATSATIIPESPAATDIALSTLTQEEADEALINLSRYGYNIRATETSIAGIVFKLDGGSDDYELPVKVTATIVEDTQLIVGKLVVGTLEYTGSGEPVSASAVVKLPATAFGDHVGDIALEAKPAEGESSLNTVITHIDCSNLFGATGGVFTSGISEANTIDGVATSTLYSGEVTFTQGLSSYIVVDGSLNKKTDYITTGVDAWVLPMSLYVNSTSENWVVRNSIDGSSWSSENYTSGEFDALVTVARSDMICSGTAYLELYSVNEFDIEEFQSTLMVCFDGVFSGYEMPDPGKAPVARNISIVRETDTTVKSQNLSAASEYYVNDNVITATLMPQKMEDDTLVYKLPFIVKFTAAEPLVLNCSNEYSVIELVNKSLIVHMLIPVTAEDIANGSIDVEFFTAEDSEYASTSYSIDISNVVLISAETEEMPEEGELNVA